MTRQNGQNMREYIQNRYESGYLKEAFYTVSGLMSGSHTEYYDGPGLPKKLAGSYRDGKAHGRFYTYFPNGKTQSITDYEDGLVNGMNIQFYPNSGGVMVRRQYKNNIRDGVIEKYSPHGRLELLAVFSENKLDLGATLELKTALRMVQIYDFFRVAFGFMRKRPNTAEQVAAARLQIGLE
jgi:antitoxin component YwqK of YwqJK toxin-antitoxin module